MTENHSSVIVQDLVKRFGDFVAVDHISLETRKGEIFGFLGPNGAGKSTTIRMLCGLLKPTSGLANVAGYDVSREPEAVRQNIGYMSQKFSLYELLSVDQNIRLYAELYGVPRARFAERRRFALEMAGLEGREKALPRDLPGGYRQRLALGCAILHEPPILFLDEPTGGVDPISRRQFWRLIDQLSRSGVTVLVTTHYLDEAEYCHRLALIHAGKLAALGTTRELKEVFADRRIFEIRTRRSVDVMRALDAMEDVEESSLFGTAVHAVLRSRHVAAAELAARLSARQIAVDSVEPVEPSLEDVFLDVVEKAGRQ